MKRNVTVIIALLLLGATAFSQAVKDRNVIPVSVNLNQVLRMTVTNGGNIEFVFNTIDDYRLGISGDAGTSLSANDGVTDAIYQTEFNVASSTRWLLNYGAENATFVGTDNPGNTLPLDNVGFSIEMPAGAAHAFGTEVRSALTADGTSVVALEQYPVLLLDDNDDAAVANAGDATDNQFLISWRCGTIEAGTAGVPMNAARLLDQQPSPSPDRYTVNVLFDLAVDN